MKKVGTKMETKVENNRYSKRAILDNLQFKKRRDLLEVLLEPDELYSLKDVEEKISQFFDRKLEQ